MQDAGMCRYTNVDDAIRPRRRVQVEDHAVKSRDDRGSRRDETRVNGGRR